MSSFFSKLISPAGLVVLVCFFLPWISVSCSGTPVMPPTTGLELSNPIVIMSQSYPGNVDLYLVLAGAAVMLLAGVVLWAGRSVLASLLALLASGIALALPLYYQYSMMEELNADPFAASMIQVTWEFGYWGVVAAAAVGVVASLASFGQQGSAPPVNHDIP